MNILMISEDHSLANFGITKVVSQLCDELALHYSDARTIILSTSQEVVQQNHKVAIETTHPVGLGKFWKWSPDLATRLTNIIYRYKIDIIHIHGIWMAAQWAGISIARKQKIPLVISAHGMFQPWLWKEQGRTKWIKKKIYYSLFLKPLVPPHAIFHALSQKEAYTLEQFFPGQSKVIIPNAITLKSSEKTKNQIIEKKFLFLGRIHPIKAVDILVQAFSNANLGDDWRLCIVGPDDVPDYAENIKKVIEGLDLTDRVELLGPVYGENKLLHFTDSWALILPSYSEGFPMVSLEAAQCSLPTILTIEAGLENWTDSGGLLVKPDVDDIAIKLVEASNWSLDQRRERGERSFNYVKENYSWEVIIPAWYELYERMTRSSS